MSVSLPEDIMKWLKLVAQLRGTTPDQLAAEIIRIFRGIWMSGYEYGRGEQAVMPTPTPSAAKIDLSIIVHGQGEIVELREGARGLKIKDFNNISLHIYGDEILETTSRQVGGERIYITAPRRHEDIKYCHIVSLDEREIKSKKFPKSRKISLKRPRDVRKIEIYYGKKALYIILLKP